MLLLILQLYQKFKSSIYFKIFNANFSNLQDTFFFIYLAMQYKNENFAESYLKSVIIIRKCDCPIQPHLLGWMGHVFGK